MIVTSTRSKGMQISISIVAILILVLSMTLGAQQISHPSPDISDGQPQSHALPHRYISSYTPRDPINISANADFAILGFPGSGTSGDPYVISGFSITSSGSCISIQDTTVYFVIRDCLLSGSQNGVNLSSSHNGEIRNNTISENEIGVSLSYSLSITILDNIIYRNDYGVYIIGAGINTVVIGNIIEANYYGVELSNTSGNTVEQNTISGGLQCVVFTTSTENTLMDNILSNCNQGMYLNGSTDNNIERNSIFESLFIGIELYNSSANTIVENILSENGNEGMRFTSSSGNTVMGNVISDTTWGTRFFHLSDNNLIYLNTFTECTHGTAVDDGTGNSWNTTDAGNFWFDYHGLGEYHILGLAGSIDHYPTSYATPPIIDSPPDQNYEEGIPGNTIIWTPLDTTPSHYVVYRNSTEVETDSWDGRSITVNIDGLSVGYYNYTIIVYDEFASSVSDEVIVIVQPETILTTTTTSVTTTTTTTTTTIVEPPGSEIVFLGLIAIEAAIAIFILMRYRKRR
ncbi:MAG: right-handed parallel beta-helix repeat-containing protein [Candidatus Thorarchaeota archaeon]